MLPAPEIRVNRSCVAAFAAVVLGACSPGDSRSGADTPGGSAARTSGGVDLTGAGATFPLPIYSKWFSDYATQTGVRINYQSIGSGGGIRQLSEGTVDFGGSDSPMTDAEIARAKGGQILHIPTVLGAVVVTYNVPELTRPLRLSGDLVADIFLGRVTKWNDARIAGLNPGAPLPNDDILVVHRSDGSGTTFVFSDYLTTVSPAWAAGPSRGKELQWPTGIGAKGNEGVAGQVKQTPGAVGYVELAYASQNRLPSAAIRNQAGNFVEPAIESITAAAATAAATLPPNTDFRVSIVNAPGAESYPISSYTWLLVYERQADPDKGKKLVDFLRWALHEGQPAAAALDYAPLPEAVVRQLDERLASIKVGTGA